MLPADAVVHHWLFDGFSRFCPFRIASTKARLNRGKRHITSALSEFLVTSFSVAVKRCSAVARHSMAHLITFPPQVCCLVISAIADIATAITKDDGLSGSLERQSSVFASGGLFVGSMQIKAV